MVLQIGAVAPDLTADRTAGGMTLTRSTERRGPKGLPGALVALVTLIGGATGAQALDPPDTPTPTAFSVLGNGAVSTIVPRGDVTYIGGNFDELAAITGAFARLHAATARRIPLAEAEFGEVRASAPDGSGGFYIGGTFGRLGGEQRDKIGHILADGSVDPNFNPAVLGQDSAVNALAVSGDGRTLYVGGSFTYIGGETRNNLAALETATGRVTSFDPAGLGTDGPVFALEVSGTQVYVGGQFERLGGQTRNGLAKVAGTTGGDLGWIPNPTQGAGGGVIRAIEALNNNVYVGGVFTGIGGRARNHLARLSATTGTAVAAFAPNPDDAVYSLLLAGQALFVGGSFNTIGGEIRPAVARLNMFTGNVAAFNVDARNSDSVLALAVAGTDLYVGGVFPDLGNPVVRSSNLVKVDAITGAGNQAFNPAIGDFGPAASVKTLAVAGTSVYVGGDIAFVNRVTRHGIAALDSDGVPTAFNPDAGPGGPNTFNDVSAIAVRGDDIYLGGNFTSMGGQPRNRIAKVSRGGALDPTFNPNATGGNIPGIDTIVVTSTDVYVGGDFSTIGGQPRLDLARLNPITGLVDGGRQTFDPDPLNGINPSRVRALQVSGDEVYVAGDFTSIGGIFRSKIAKISGATGDADVQFDANVSGGSNVGPGISEIVLARGTLFVGGDFSVIGGAARNNIATLNPKTGAEVTGFNPNVTGGQRPQVLAIAVTDDEVYIGGSFLQVGGEAQGQIARLTKTGALTDFNPRIRDQPGAVLALATSSTTLYAGGLFFEINQRRRLKYAQFEEALTPIALDTTDASNPTSEVQPLDGVQDRALFAVEWAGEDEGAGVRDFSVFASEDGGPFTPWQTNTQATRAMFLGEDGKTYEFYSVARDLTGNLEVKGPLAEATTRVLVRADDGDGDGVPDGEDRCPDSDLGPTVVIDPGDTGLANVLASPAGCTLMDRIIEAGSGALNRRQFVRRVVLLTRTWLGDGLIDEEQAGVIRTAAEQTILLPP